MQLPRLRSVFNFGFEPGSWKGVAATSIAMTAITVGLIFGGLALLGGALTSAAITEAGTVGIAGAMMVGAGALSGAYELAYLGAVGNDFVQTRRELRAQREQVRHLEQNGYRAKALDRDIGLNNVAAANMAMSTPDRLDFSQQPRSTVDASTAAMQDMLAAYEQAPEAVR